MQEKKAMSLTFIQSLQKKLGKHTIDKIDPNADQQNTTLHAAQTDKFMQYATAAVLAGLYKYGRTSEGASAILNQSGSVSLTDIFKNHDNEVVQNVASSTQRTTEETRSKMEDITLQAASCIRESVGDKASSDTLKTWLAAQRQSILSYLPAELGMGQILNDGTLDDRTNKMEGPVSSFIHAMGASFSTNSDDKNEQKDWD